MQKNLSVHLQMSKICRTFVFDLTMQRYNIFFKYANFAVVRGVFLNRKTLLIINILQIVTKNLVVRLKLYALLGVTILVNSCQFGDFEAKNSLKEAERLYHLGTSSNQQSRYEESTLYLKQAEESFLAIQQSAVSSQDWQRRNQLLGNTWFYMGNSCESDQLYTVAQDYYRKAVPLLEQGSNTVFLACAYRDLARTIAIAQGERDSALHYFRLAEHYARQAQSDLLVLDVQAYRYQLCYPDSVAQRLDVCRRLAEEHGAHARYSELVELLLAEQATESAAYYLERLQPKDSSYTYWFEQSYTYLKSKVLRQRGQTDSAYALLLDLYDRKIDELQRDAGARTYALALHYDVEREKHLAEEAQRERRWQQTVSSILVLVLALVVALLLVLWRYWQQRRREQAAVLQALQEKYVQQLQLALERLQQKVSLTREIEMQRLRGNEPEFPKWLQTYRDEQLTMNKESLDELIASVDNALDGAISRLRADYPQLTESDMQFAILSIIGASDNDMSILLNVQKQTIYHRRQIVRKHVDGQIDDIDAWLRRYVLKV